MQTRRPKGEGKIYEKLLVRVCELVAPLVLNLRTRMRIANLFCYILEILNILGVMIKVMIENK